jgi:hypothetical protein
VREESQYLEAEILLHLLFSKSNTEFWEQWPRISRATWNPNFLLAIHVSWKKFLVPI